MGYKPLSCVLLLPLLTFQLVAKEDCDCYRPPWSEDCAKICMNRLLNKASTAELEDTLHVSDSVAVKIVRARDRKKYSSVNDLRDILSPDEVKAIKDRVSSLTEKKSKAAQGEKTEKQDK